MALSPVGDSLYWNGSYTNDKAFVVTGKFYIASKPSIGPNPPEDMSNFILDRQLLLDVGMQLGGQQTEKEHQSVQCLICSTKKQYPLQKMRDHIGHHCGFCDEIWCGTQLHKTSASGGTSYFKLKSDCKYFFAYKRIPWYSNKEKRINHVYNEVQPSGI